MIWIKSANWKLIRLNLWNWTTPIRESSARFTLAMWSPFNSIHLQQQKRCWSIRTNLFPRCTRWGGWRGEKRSPAHFHILLGVLLLCVSPSSISMIATVNKCPWIKTGMGTLGVWSWTKETSNFILKPLVKNWGTRRTKETPNCHPAASLYQQL